MEAYAYIAPPCGKMILKLKFYVVSTCGGAPVEFTDPATQLSKKLFGPTDPNTFESYITKSTYGKWLFSVNTCTIHPEVVPIKMNCNSFGGQNLYDVIPQLPGWDSDPGCALMIMFPGTTHCFNMGPHALMVNQTYFYNVFMCGGLMTNEGLLHELTHTMFLIGHSQAKCDVFKTGPPASELCSHKLDNINIINDARTISQVGDLTCLMGYPIDSAPQAGRYWNVALADCIGVAMPVSPYIDLSDLSIRRTSKRFVLPAVENTANSFIKLGVLTQTIIGGFPNGQTGHCLKKIEYFISYHHRFTGDPMDLLQQLCDKVYVHTWAEYRVTTLLLQQLSPGDPAQAIDGRFMVQCLSTTGEEATVEVSFL